MERNDPDSPYILRPCREKDAHAIYEAAMESVELYAILSEMNP